MCSVLLILAILLSLLSADTVPTATGSQVPNSVPTATGSQVPDVIPTATGTISGGNSPGFCSKANEVWSYCNGGCDRTCKNYYPVCPAICRPGCVCRDYYVRDCSGNCVPYWTCYYQQQGPCCPACQWYELCTQPTIPGGQYKCIQWYGKSGTGTGK
ncbi:hypothetical protein L596_013926 [Steinernema carpocapsae]|uniref:TIL domain-containing protein n=1 Tax=Steinernema carpocapsae TaxID=34508 RepID=A0A4U5P1L4_STECR|nr:hypothetical protein L596_013926 [Steinernema carpocapsae]